MNNINIINGRIFDYNLIQIEKNNPQLNDALNGCISLTECKNLNIKKVLLFTNPEVINMIDLKTMDEDLKKVLKVRLDIYENSKQNIIDKIIDFYNFFPQNSLYQVLKRLLSLNEAELTQYKDNYLMPKYVLEFINNGLKDEKTVKEMLKKDVRTCKFITDSYPNKPELVRFMLENNAIDEEYVIKNFTEELANDKELITKFILYSPKAYRYFDHNVINLSMIDELLKTYKENKNYKNFCSDFNFYKHLMPGAGNIYKAISKYIPLYQVGKNYYGVCPFHDDHSPSLCVSIEKNIWTCFSCGAHGSAQKFVGMYEHFPISMNNLYRQNIKNQFLYYLYANLPEKLKLDRIIIEKFLERDGCILKLVPKELKYDEELVSIAMHNDITAFRYIINNPELQKKYLDMYPVLKYYMPKKA